MTDTNFDPVVLTQSLVKCASITPEDNGALKIVSKHLSKLGFNCNALKFSGSDSYEVNNLFATIGDEGKHFVYAGHTDVVPVGNEESWKFPPFSATIEGDKLYGRGSEDMKSSVACFISATKRFIDKYKKIPGKLSFIITGDEEKDSVNGTPKILEWATRNKYKFDHCLVGEPTSKKEIGDKIKIGRRGAISFYLHVKGIQGHTANAHLAENAAHHLIRLLNNILDEPLDNGNENFLPSSTQVATFDVGNPAQNIIPEIAKATVNIRFNDMHSSDSLVKWMEKKIKNYFLNVKNASCQFTYDSTAESFLNKPSYMCDLISKSVAEVTGRNSKPEYATDGGTSDARYIKNYCEVVELGIINQSLHKVDEFVHIKDIIELERIYFQILDNYFN
tara:strand:+ start:266 stop:1438 length:1173 start_codon:yes stop_codon:yes gene_type:complete